MNNLSLQKQNLFCKNTYYVERVIILIHLDSLMLIHSLSKYSLSASLFYVLRISMNKTNRWKQGGPQCADKTNLLDADKAQTGESRDPYSTV